MSSSKLGRLERFLGRDVVVGSKDTPAWDRICNIVI